MRLVGFFMIIIKFRTLMNWKRGREGRGVGLGKRNLSRGPLLEVLQFLDCKYFTSYKEMKEKEELKGYLLSFVSAPNQRKRNKELRGPEKAQLLESGPN